jgi:hypothetical protein
MAAYLKKVATFDNNNFDEDEEESRMSRQDVLAITGCVALGATAIFSAVAAVNAMAANKTSQAIKEQVDSWEVASDEDEKSEKSEKKPEKK